MQILKSLSNNLADVVSLLEIPLRRVPVLGIMVELFGIKLLLSSENGHMLGNQGFVAFLLNCLHLFVDT